MRRWLGVGALIGLMLALGGCARGTVQDALGMGKRSPDEFAVVSRAPLIVPPDFGLRPPRPGDTSGRPGVDTPREVARASLVGNPDPGLTAGPQDGGLFGGADDGVGQVAASDDGAEQTFGAADDGQGSQSVGLVAAGFGEPLPVVVSRGEEALVAEATRTPPDPNIRSKIAVENQQLAEVEQELFTRLIKWRDPAALGTTIDAQAEAVRLRTNRAQGKPATEGQPVVIVQRRTSVLQDFLQEVF